MTTNSPITCSPQSRKKSLSSLTFTLEILVKIHGSEVGSQEKNEIPDGCQTFLLKEMLK